jgi:hypothetical protein
MPKAHGIWGKEKVPETNFFNQTPNYTSSHRSALFESSSVKIGRAIRPVDSTKEKKLTTKVPNRRLTFFVCVEPPSERLLIKLGNFGGVADFINRFKFHDAERRDFNVRICM